jgi:hypothetical protein
MPIRSRLAAAIAASVLGWTMASALPVQAGHSATAILPDLSMLPPSDFRIVVRDNGRRLLRFSTIAVNLGPGPFQIVGYDADGSGGSSRLAVRQEILEADGSFSRHATSATMFWGGDGHNHYHVANGQKWTLRNTANRTIARGTKIGFCFLDSHRWVATTEPRYTGASNVCQMSKRRIEMGISPGWGDIYRSNLRFQWIEITGVPNGEYLLRVGVDPPFATGGRFIEANDGNNRAWARIRIKGSAVTVLSTSVPPVPHPSVVQAEPVVVAAADPPPSGLGSGWSITGSVRGPALACVIDGRGVPAA